MQVGGGVALRSDINVTPLVDVVLVLLIIFMVITPIVQMGYLVKVPPKAPPSVPTEVIQDQIILRFTPENRIFINKDEVPREVFSQRLNDILKGNKNKMVFFAGDPELNYEAAISFLDLAKASGANNIGIVVEEMAQ